MFKNILLLSSVLALSACAYALENHVQEVRFETPGAENAMCNVYVEGLRHKVRPPQTINIKNTDEDLVVECHAPGNRKKTIYVRPHTAKTADLNVLNLGLGFAFDGASGALFKYPDVIEINFTDAPVVPEALPAHNNPEIRQPEDYPLEEFKPSRPKLNDDQYKEEPELKRRDRSTGFSSQGDGSSGAFYEPSGDLSGKGNLQNATPIPGS